MAALRIQVSSSDFQAACSDGWVDGLWQGRKGLCVYVELGQEKPYLTRPYDDPNTNYRLFLGCDAYFARSQPQLERGDYEASQLNAIVIIYC